MRPALALVLLCVACAGRRVPAEAIESQAPWETRSGKRQAQLDIASAMIDAGSNEQALAYVNQLRQAEGGGSSAELDVLQARAMHGLGLYEDAESILLGVVKRHKRDPDAWNQLGILRMDMGRVPDAIDAFEQALKAEPEDAELFNNLGFAYMTAARYDEAVETLRASLKLDGSQPRTRNNLGFALVASGKDDEAYRVFRASLPEAEARYNLGLAMELRGDTAAATEAYRKAVKENPQHTKALTRLSALTTDKPVIPGALSPPPTRDPLEVQ